MYDLVLKGGTVVDPSVGLHGVYDIAVQDGTIAQIAPTIPREGATRVLEVAAARQADISVLQVHDGDWVVYDVLGASLRVKQAIVPVLTVKRGEVFTRDWGLRPWGWEPDPAPSRSAAFKSCC
jgi:predicted amidohydrolase